LITGVDHHIGGIGSMYELIAQNQKGKPGYETWINNRVVTVAELLRDAEYHTYLSGKWHPSGNNFENGTWPHDRGFEKSFTLLNGRRFCDPSCYNSSFIKYKSRGSRNR
jgi:arylsulfatase A-like enzyme